MREISVIVVLVLTIIYQFKLNIDKSKELEEIKAQIVKDATKIRELQTSQATIASEARKAQALLESYKTREATVLSKRGLVQIKLNKSYKKDQNSLECLTGGECEQ